MTHPDIPTELAEGAVLVVTHKPTCLVIRVKTVHGVFAGVGYLVETQEGNLALVKGWTGFTANITLLPFNTRLEDAIALYGPAQG
jgi:hypothetical protein